MNTIEQDVNINQESEGSGQPIETVNNPEKSGLDQHAQAAVNKAINKKHAQYKEEERKRMAAEAELAKFKAEAEQRNKPSRPDIPEIPDPYDDNFEELMAARDSKIREAIEFDAAQRIEGEALAKKKEEADKERQRSLDEKIDAYEKRADELGISKEEMVRSGEYVAGSGIDENVASYLLADDHGPAIVSYLSNNPMELDKLIGINPVQVGVMINDIKSRVVTQKNIVTSAPDPVKGISGKPSTQQSPLISGATFE